MIFMAFAHIGLYPSIFASFDDIPVALEAFEHGGG